MLIRSRLCLVIHLLFCCLLVSVHLVIHLQLLHKLHHASPSLILEVTDFYHLFNIYGNDSMKSWLPWVTPDCLDAGSIIMQSINLQITVLSTIRFSRALLIEWEIRKRICSNCVVRGSLHFEHVVQASSVLTSSYLLAQSAKHYSCSICYFSAVIAISAM